MKFLIQSYACKRMPYMLIVAMLFLFYCSATASFFTAEHHCIYDSIVKGAGPPSRAIVLNLPHQGRSGLQVLTASRPEWKPIRFCVFTEDLNNKVRHCTRKGQWRPDFRGETVLCRKEHILTPAKRNIILNQVLPRATKLHSERLLVQPMTSPIVVPDDMHVPCSQFTVPSSHHTEGVKDADMVLYVAAGPTMRRAAGWAIHCTLLENGRPIVGVMNLNPSEVSSQELFVRVAAHEIAHTLGFNMYTFWRMEMLTELRFVRGKPSVLLVKTPKTVEKARAHYNCSTAPGMELEDEGGAGTTGHHWERRNARDELMAGIAGVGYYSALTMALFEDMGFYRANWTMAETMNWGRNSGCRLLTMKCMINGITTYPDMFCTSRRNRYILSCTPNRFGLGRCPIYAYQNVSYHYQYFKNPRHGGGSDGYTDLCPVITSFPQTSCTDGYPKSMPGSRVGPTSRCLKGKRLLYKGDRIGDVCAEVQCHKNRSVSVRYLGNNAWHRCTEDKSIKPKGNFTRGRIMCPKYSEVCFETGGDTSSVDLSSTRVKIIGRKGQRARRYPTPRKVSS